MTDHDQKKFLFLSSVYGDDIKTVKRVRLGLGWGGRRSEAISQITNDRKLFIRKLLIVESF